MRKDETLARTGAHAAYPMTTAASAAKIKIWAFRPADEFQLDGFDWARPADPGFIVPSGVTRRLGVSVAGPEPLVVANPEEIESAGLCQVEIAANVLAITGRAPGQIAVELQKGDARQPLEITIKAERVVPIVAHFVEHGPQLRTRMTAPTLQKMIETADRILMADANVRVRLLDHQALTHQSIGANLGRTVRTGPDVGRDEWELVTCHALKAADVRHLLPRPGISESDLRWLMNLFLVRRFEDDDRHDPDAAPGKRQPREAAETRRLSGNCILEDQFSSGALDVTRAGRTLAHEIGHRLGIEKHAPDSSFLMYKSQPHGDRLSLHDAHLINPSGCGPLF